MMTLRERIADWISGGALTRARQAERECVYGWCDTALGKQHLYDVLQSIEAETTRDPSRPSIKRIARIAREALE